MSRNFLTLALMVLLGAPASGQEARRSLKILFLGDDGPHRPVERFRQIQPVLADRGIDLTYTGKAEALSPGILGSYDGLLIYSNLINITPEQEKALFDFVEGGKGFIPIHCASYCFLNSPRYIELVGAQFKRHGAGVFRTSVVDASHPIVQGYRPFESWDETYVHHKHHEVDRTVLEVRDENGVREPWTWVRRQGKGRVFYTAWGHDERTWGNAGFQSLIERGIRWTVGEDVPTSRVAHERPAMMPLRKDVKPFEYLEGVKIPFYPMSQQWGKLGEPIAKMQKPLEAHESLKHMVTPADFEVKLFASDPNIKRPICMNWDERGRLWIAESVDYPNELKREGEGRDRIVVCEDTDRDGVADEFTVFADRLSIPTGFTFYRGGLIVLQAPHTLFLRDNDGDGIADERRILFTGWHTHDTHAGPSNLQMGFDNWIYGMVGYSGFDGVVGGEKHSFRTGFFRFRPDGSKLEFLRNTNNNSWGVGFSEDGILFGSTANGNPSVHLPIPNRYYESVRGWSSSVLGTIADHAKIAPITDKVRQVDHHGNFTAAAGHALYTARAYPREYWNRTAFVTEPTGHLVATFRIRPDGASFRSTNSWNLLASDDEWTSPTMAEVGPDGNVWVIDWYNYIVQHNPTPTGFKTGKGNAYETPLRDKVHGRVVRIVARGTPPSPALSLKDAAPAQLVATLKNDNLFWRRHAQRLLVERGQRDVIPGLLELANDRSVDTIGLNPGAIHALWTLHGLGVLDGTHAEASAAATSALKHRSAGVRRNAVLVLPPNEASLASLIGLLHDVDPQVRLATLLMLAEMPPSPRAGTALVTLLREQGAGFDRWLLDAATCAAARHDRGFLTALLTDRVATPAAIKPLVERVAEHHGRAAPTTIGSLLDALAAGSADDAVAVLVGLARGWPADKAPPQDSRIDAALRALFPRLPPGERSALIRLANRWKNKVLDSHVAEIAAGLLSQLRDEKSSDAVRGAAAVQLVDLRRHDTKVAAEILGLFSPRLSPELSRDLLDAVGRSEAEGIGAELGKLLPTLTPSARSAAYRILLGRPDWTRLLLTAFEKGTVSPGELSLEQKQVLLAHPTKAVAAKAKVVLAKAGGLPSPDRQKILDELMPLTRQSGDVAAGKLVFKTHCAKCHTHSGEGAKIGPDLTGMAVHPKSHLLTEIIDPNRSVEGNYRQWVVSTRAGRVVSGLLASESKTAVELIDTEGKKHVIQRDDIDELQATTKSLMPEGFEKQTKADDLVNLLEFLTQRGRYLPLPLDRVATAVSTRGMFVSEKANAERLIFSDWSPKSFEGIPFVLVDPQGDRVPNVILFYGPGGYLPPKMPRNVELPVNAPARAIHMLSGVAGWAFPLGTKGSVTLIARIHYTDGTREDHALKNGEHFADYIRRVDVPASKFAFALRGQQIRYLAIHPRRTDPIARLEFVRGNDGAAPVIMAITLESLREDGRK